MATDHPPSMMETFFSRESQIVVNCEGLKRICDDLESDLDEDSVRKFLETVVVDDEDEWLKVRRKFNAGHFL
jgi:hypothetical protein